MNKKIEKKRVLLFDYDGTIADSLNVIMNEFNKVAVKYKLKIFESEKEFVKMYQRNFYESVLLMGLPKDKIKNFIEEFRSPLISRIREMKIFDGMKEVIDKLSKSSEIFIITSNMTDIIRKSIEHYGLRGIKGVIGGDRNLSKVEKIKMVLAKYKSVDAYYIGDTVGDVVEGKKAGVRTIAVGWGYHTKKELASAKADFVVDKPEDLINIFA